MAPSLNEDVSYQQPAAWFKKGATVVKDNSGTLTKIPSEIFELSNTLEILNLSGNPKLSSLPSKFPDLVNLKVLFLSDCSFMTFPEVLSKCPSLEMVAFKNNGMEFISEKALPPNLRWLILTQNKITSLPTSIGKCTRLQKCMLAGNQLTSIPDPMRNCRKLGLLRLSANKLESIPDWLYEMPELAFLAFAGNPCSKHNAMELELDVEKEIADEGLDNIHWDELAVDPQHLGEGASGIISRAHHPKSSSHVAVKVFRGEVTSDGSPLDEMAACLSVGAHPNVISTIGRVHSHPDSKTGLVLELISPEFTALGNPPNFATCTRDTFDARRYDVSTILRILIGIAFAGNHLHRKTIAHGDLYAHNILISPSGHTLLGDFGAATVYGTSHPSAHLIERLEVRAFGHLIDDLLSLAKDIGDSNQNKTAWAKVADKLVNLEQRCTGAEVSKRPGFEQILLVLLKSWNGDLKLPIAEFDGCF